MRTNDGRVIKVKLSQFDYIELRGQAELSGRTMASIVRDALRLYFWRQLEVKEPWVQPWKPYPYPNDQKPWRPDQNDVISVYGCPSWITTCSTEEGDNNER